MAWSMRSPSHLRSQPQPPLKPTDYTSIAVIQQHRQGGANTASKGTYGNYSFVALTENVPNANGAFVVGDGSAERQFDTRQTPMENRFQTSPGTNFSTRGPPFQPTRAVTRPQTTADISQHTEYTSFVSSGNLGHSRFPQIRSNTGQSEIFSSVRQSARGTQRDSQNILLHSHNHVLSGTPHTLDAYSYDRYANREFPCDHCAPLRMLQINDHYTVFRSATFCGGSAFLQKTRPQHAFWRCCRKKRIHLASGQTRMARGGVVGSKPSDRRAPRLLLLSSLILC